MITLLSWLGVRSHGNFASAFVLLLISGMRHRLFTMPFRLLILHNPPLFAVSLI